MTKNISPASCSHSFSAQTKCKADVGASYCSGQAKNGPLRSSCLGLLSLANQTQKVVNTDFVALLETRSY